MSRVTVLAAALGLAVFSAPEAWAAEKIELKQVHMCCGGCAKAVAGILKKVDGVSGVAVDEEKTSAAFTAVDTKTAEAALDALAKGGFHGQTGSPGAAFKDDSGVKPGKVKALTVSGFHNSCPGCVASFREAIKGVPGVTGDTCKSKVRTCQVTGDFDAAELVKALNKAGFHVQVSGQ